MPKTYALKCPGCGADLKVGNNLTTFACAYCGNNVKVEKAEGIVSLQLTHAIAQVQRGTDKTAAELAIVRLNKEIEEANVKLQDVIKAKAAPFPMDKSTKSTGCLVVIIAFISLGIMGVMIEYLLITAVIALVFYYSSKKYEKTTIAEHMAQLDTQEQQLQSHISDLEQRLQTQRTIANS